MKAVVINKFGGPDVMQITEVPAPQPQAGEILIKVSYAGVNPVDWKIREGFLKDLFPHHFPLILGWDVAGTVAAVGAGVTTFKVGDRVYAYARKPEVQWGCYAEFVTVDNSAAALTPRNLKDEQAAGVPLTALTAWQGLFDFAQLKPQQVVLIHAGAGGVGSFAIQFAKSIGATVITTGTSGKHSYLHDLGADTVIDYTKEDFSTKIKELYPAGIDVVYDAVGGETLDRSFAVLKRGGVLVSIVDNPNPDVAADKGIRAGFIFVQPSGEQLAEIGSLIDKGKVKASPSEVIPMEEVQQAHLKSQSHRTLGKIVLDV